MGSIRVVRALALLGVVGLLAACDAANTASSTPVSGRLGQGGPADHRAADTAAQFGTPAKQATSNAFCWRGAIKK